MFADDPEALLYVREGILDTLIQLGTEKNTLQETFDLNSELAIKPEDGLTTALKKAALSRVLGVGDAINAYGLAADRLGNDFDKGSFLRVFELFIDDPAADLPQYGFYVTQNSGVLIQGDLIVDLTGQAFSYADGWVFKTELGYTNLAGIMEQELPEEQVSLRIIRHTDSGFSMYDIDAAISELSAGGMIGV